MPFRSLILPIPKDNHHYHYMKAKVTVRVHLDESLSIFHGPRRLARYTPTGELIKDKPQAEVASIRFTTESLTN